jgi:hypothetical protein
VTPGSQAGLPVPVEVDERSGRWSVDGIPMILAPQHMILNYLAAAESSLGVDAVAALVRAPGHRSAHTWCARARAFHGLDEVAVVHHYLDQLGRRGWGRFTMPTVDVDAGVLEVHLERSALAHADGRAADAGCYVFCGWLEGALDAARVARGRDAGFVVRETACAGAGADACVFTGTVPGGDD